MIRIRNQQAGFTLIEILMVLVLIAILALIGITQFTNFTTNTRNETTRANLQILRRGIATQNGQMRVKCNYQGVAWPTYLNVAGNDITTGAGANCTLVQVPVPDNAFVQGVLPSNPWSDPTLVANAIGDCTTNAGTSCVRAANLKCGTAATAIAAAATGWCYNSGTGEIWADTMRNDGLAAATGNENAY